MCLYVSICIVTGIIFGSIWSVLLSIYENIETLNIINYFKIPKCKECKKKLKIKEFIPLLGLLFQKSKCVSCKRRVVTLRLILEIGTAILFWLIWYCLHDSWIYITIFWMLTGWILRLICLCDIIRYEVHIPLIVFWMMLVVLSMCFWLYEWYYLWWAVVFLFIFFILYFVTLWYIRRKYKTEEEWVWMGDVIISPYLWTLLYIWLSTTNVEELYFWVLMFFVLTGFSWVFVYVIKNVILNQKAEFLSKNMADNALPLIPSMMLSLVVVIICHNVMFNYWIGVSDSILEKLSNNTL